MNAYTLTEALHRHGIHGTGDTLTDNAREAGIVYACLGCGSIGYVDVPDNWPTAREQARIATREAIDWDAFECCIDADTATF